MSSKAMVLTIKHLREQRDYMAERLADYESGKWRIERSEGGRKIDETLNTIADLKRRIAALDRVIAPYENF